MKRLLLVLAVLAGAVLVLPEFASARGRAVASRRTFVGPRGGVIVRERNVVSPGFVGAGFRGRSVVVAPHGVNGAFFVPRGGTVVTQSFGVVPSAVVSHVGGDVLFVPNGFGGFTAIQRSPFIGNGAVFVGPPFGF